MAEILGFLHRALQFVDTEEATDIQVTCVNQDNKNNLQSSNDHWLESMTEKEVYDLIQTSSTQELCGRRPWTNVENNQKKFPDGNPQGTALQTVRGKHDTIFSMG